MLNLMNIFSKNKEKVIVSVRNNRSNQDDTTMKKIENLGIRLFYKKSDKIVSLSYGVTDDLNKNFNIPLKNIKTIYNFFDMEKIRLKSLKPMPQEKYDYFKENVILSMGRLNPQKNFIGLIDAMSKVVKKRNDVRLIILGRGELHQELKQKIIDLRLSDNVFILDYCENPFPLIRKANIFVMNSHFEGFCNSIVEALACNTFTISTDCKSGPREIIAEEKEYTNSISQFRVCKRGILVPTNNSEELSKAILYALDNPQVMNECIEQANKYIINYSNEDIEKQWLELITEEQKC